MEINLKTDVHTSLNVAEAVSQQYRTRMQEVRDINELASPSEVQLKLVVAFTAEMARLEQFHTEIQTVLDLQKYTLAEFWAEVDFRVANA